VNPAEFQTLAGELLTRRTPQAFRAAVGRSYYAAFNVAAEALRSHFPISKGPVPMAKFPGTSTTVALKS
jgi:hypothetical protein